MTPHELYEVLDNAGVDYEVVEIFDGHGVATPTKHLINLGAKP